MFNYRFSALVMLKPRLKTPEEEEGTGTSGPKDNEPDSSISGAGALKSFLTHAITAPFHTGHDEQAKWDYAAWDTSITGQYLDSGGELRDYGWMAKEAPPGWERDWAENWAAFMRNAGVFGKLGQTTFPGHENIWSQIGADDYLQGLTPGGHGWAKDVPGGLQQISNIIGIAGTGVLANRMSKERHGIPLLKRKLGKEMKAASMNIGPNIRQFLHANKVSQFFRGNTNALVNWWAKHNMDEVPMLQEARVWEDGKLTPIGQEIAKRQMEGNLSAKEKMIEGIPLGKTDTYARPGGRIYHNPAKRVYETYQEILNDQEFMKDFSSDKRMKTKKLKTELEKRLQGDVEALTSLEETSGKGLKKGASATDATLMKRLEESKGLFVQTGGDAGPVPKYSQIFDKSLPSDEQVAKGWKKGQATDGNWRDAMKSDYPNRYTLKKDAKGKLIDEKIPNPYYDLDPEDFTTAKSRSYDMTRGYDPLTFGDTSQESARLTGQGRRLDGDLSNMRWRYDYELDEIVPYFKEHHHWSEPGGARVQTYMGKDRYGIDVDLGVEARRDRASRMMNIRAGNINPSGQVDTGAPLVSDEAKWKQHQMDVHKAKWGNKLHLLYPGIDPIDVAMLGELAPEYLETFEGEDQTEAAAHRLELMGLLGITDALRTGFHRAVPEALMSRAVDTGQYEDMMDRFEEEARRKAWERFSGNVVEY